MRRGWLTLLATALLATPALLLDSQGRVLVGDEIYITELLDDRVRVLRPVSE